MMRPATGFGHYLRDMVYGARPDFETAMATLKILAESLKKRHA